MQSLRATILLAVFLLEACGSTPPRTGTAGDPGTVGTLATREASFDADAQTCATEADALPETVLVERELAPCGCPNSDDNTLCLEGTDDVGPSVIDRVGADGTSRVAGTPCGVGRLDASDVRTTTAHEFRYVRWVGGSENGELVTVRSDGEVSITPGGAARPMLLGGRSWKDSSSADGRLRAELQMGPGTGDARRREMVLFDTTVNPVAGFSCLDAGGCREVGRMTVGGSGEVQVQVANDGSGMVALEGSADHASIVRFRDGQVDRISLQAMARAWVEASVGAAGGPRLLAVGPRLDAFALSQGEALWIVGPGERFVRSELGRIRSALFDPCGRWLYTLTGAPRSGALLSRVSLDGVHGPIADLPAWVVRLDIAPDGSALLGIGESMEHSNPLGPEVVLVSPFDGATRPIRIGDGAQRVVFDRSP
ncbi:MAG: hypothetical protein GXP55_25590 [Deltaproteobacteria bacterium]|nr:hypothetical protein [Deltaproteobacteria bacterium]